jgi:molybdopterin molybdotransferase
LRLLQVSAVEEVLQIIAQSFGPLETEEIELAIAGGRYPALDIIAGEDVPAFTRSTVDGYAVRANETFGAQENLPAFLHLAGEVKMGEPAFILKNGEACYLPTGGMLPAGADAVVMLEYTEVTGSLLNIYRQVAPGENLIQAGEDLACGQLVLKEGRKLRGPELGLLASLGLAKVNVVKKPRVAIFSSGDELAPWKTETLSPGQIRDSNGIALTYLAQGMGVEANYLGILPDEYPVFRDEISKGLAEADLVVISGGSSVGARDYTARALAELGGGRLLVEGVAIQPGKPTLIASAGGKPLLGLPGHPVSALNIFALFGSAIIRRLSGAKDPVWKASVRAVLTKNIPSRPGRTDLVRVSLQRTEQGVNATPIFGRSGLLRTLAEADGIIWIAAAADGLLAGEIVEVFLWD